MQQQSQSIKVEADDANSTPTQSMSNGKVADVFSELNSVVESLSKSNEELIIKELAIKSLEHELVKARNLDAKFSEKEAHMNQLKAELAKSKERSQQLDSSEIESLKSKLKRANEAEENNNKAMDDLALALQEVAAEASQAKDKLVAALDEVRHYKKESEDSKEALAMLEKRHKTLIEEAKKEADLQRNIADRLRLEAEETLEAWSGKEMGLVDFIKRVEDEKIAAVEENTKLIEALKIAKQENQKLRDILKQALNEANVAKEAAGIARFENSQLKDVLAEKDNALMFITRENENLRINEYAMMEQIKELERLLSESPDEEHENTTRKKNQDKKTRI